jgi:hypothetical protein
MFKIFFFYKLYDFFLRILVRIIPKINRAALIDISKKNDSICIVEDAYEFEVKEPKQKTARYRFKNSVGLRKVDCFFGTKLRDIRLIGPYGIPVTRFGQIILEPISRRSLVYVIKLTIKKIGLMGFVKQYFFAICPYFDLKKNLLEVGAHLVCRGLKEVMIDNQLHLTPVFGHWMGEQLPQLRGIEAVINKNNFTNCKLIINKSPPKWQMDSLELMGFDKKNIKYMDADGLRVDHLIVASLRNVKSSGMECDPKARLWAAKRLQSYYDHKNFTNENVINNICLFRQDAPTRRINNIEAIRENIKLNQFTEIDVSNKNLFDSGKDFIFAKRFLACFGGGISRIMFSKNLKELIEIYSCDQDDRDVFFLLASEMDIEYKCIAAGKLPKSISSQGEKFLSSKNYEENERCANIQELSVITNEWHVPTEKLAAVLNTKN